MQNGLRVLGVDPESVKFRSFISLCDCRKPQGQIQGGTLKTPKLEKEGEIVKCMYTNALQFST